MAAFFQPTVTTPRQEAIEIDGRTRYAGAVVVGHGPKVEIRARVDAVLQCGAFEAHEIAPKVLSLAANVEQHV